MAGVANDAFNYSKGSNEEIEEEEEEQIYNSIDDDSSEYNDLEDEIESIDRAIDSKIKSIEESKNLNLRNSNGGNTHETCSQRNGNGDNVIKENLPIKVWSIVFLLWVPLHHPENQFLPKCRQKR